MLMVVSHVHGGARGRRLTGALVIAMVVAALVAGCGDDEPETARLVVRERLPAQPVYVEGSVSFLRVVGPGQRVVWDGPVTNGRQVRGRRPIFERSLSAGEYRIVSYQRPCQGSCRSLDPATDRCESRVRAESGAVLTAEVTLSPRGGCRIATSETR